MSSESGYRLAVQESEGATRIAIGGRVGIENAQRLLREIQPHLKTKPREVALDLSEVDYFDSAGGAVVLYVQKRLADAGVPFRIASSTPDVDALLDLVDRETLLAPPAPKPRHMIAPVRQVGTLTMELLYDFRELVVFTGEVMLGLWDALRLPHRVRWRDTWLYMERTGVDALPIVALISFLMGLIMGFQAAVQMAQFGADIYVANLVGLAIVRELGPLMTAIIAAGRSGAAFAAEIGTMKVSEEVDALQVMGFDRARFLITPKVLALILMLPCLTLFSDVVGIIGGLTVGKAWLDLPIQVYLRQTRVAMSAWDVYSGVVKSVAFAILISGVGCLRGFQATAGAQSVGRITTSAIVTGIFFIIITDAVFTILFHYW